MNHRILTALLVAASLAGCATPGLSPQTSTSAALLQNARGGTPVLDADLARSCAELGTMAGNLYARHEEIAGAAHARQRNASILGGVANAGLGMLGLGLGARGGIDGIRTAAVATDLANTATNAALMGASSASLKEINDSTAIVNRLGQIERARLQKDCEGGPLRG